jgi:hypothetical protein
MSTEYFIVLREKGHNRMIIEMSHEQNDEILEFIKSNHGKIVPSKGWRISRLFQMPIRFKQDLEKLCNNLEIQLNDTI